MRLLTRSDFDGLVCAALLYEAEIITDIKFVHPKDVQDGKIEVTTDDVLANVPYAAGSGLGRYKDYRISNYQLMEKLSHKCRHESVANILSDTDVQERIKRYFEQEAEYEGMVQKYTRTDRNVLIIDLHDCPEIVTGNRFKEYVLYPDQNISIRIIWGFQKQNMVMTVGHSVFNRSSKTNVGKLMLKYGGGGHPYVGTCQVPVDNWEAVRDEIIATLKA